MVLVVSKDGFITQGDNPNPSAWSSKEDQENYHKILSEFSTCVMGERTYQATKNVLPEKTIKIVLTKKRKTSNHQDVIYESGPVQEIVARLSKKFNSALLLGGAFTYRQFLENNLVDKAIVTIEPVNLFEGISLFNTTDNPVNIFRNLLDKESKVSRLNDKDTLLYEFNR